VGGEGERRSGRAEGDMRGPSCGGVR
jgi:hypothetical protein